MPQAEKRGNSWRIQAYNGRDENGKRIMVSITADTKAECEYKYAVWRKKEKGKTKCQLTVRSAIEKYISQCDDLSPSTICGYEKVLKHGFPGLMDTPVSDLTQDMIQQSVKDEAHRCSVITKKPISAKTVKNEYGLLAAALKKVGFTCGEIKLPKVKKRPKLYPDPENVIRAFTGTEIELPCMLAMRLSFSMSEVRGIRYSDIHDGYITLNRVKIHVDSLDVIKNDGKVETRLRIAKIPPYIEEMLEKDQGYQNYKKTGNDDFLIKFTPDGLYRRWKTISTAHGWDLTFHDLRHMYCSTASYLGLPDVYIEHGGGWSSDHVMKSTYRHTFDRGRLEFEQQMDGLFSQALGMDIQSQPKKSTI